MPDCPDNASRQHDSTALQETAAFARVLCGGRLVNPDRCMNHLGTANVDDNAKAVSESLAVQVTRKAMQLQILA